MHFAHGPLILPLHSAKDIKHKISFLLQKPEPQAADQKQMKEKSTTAAAKRLEEQASLSWICCLKDVFYALSRTLSLLRKREFLWWKLKPSLPQMLP